jgi:probable F420-dependent oxidoreductase
VKLGVMPFNIDQPLSDPDWTVEMAQRVESTAAESLWAYEHVVFPAEYASIYPYDPLGRMTSSQLQEDRPDPLQWLGHIAAVTSRVKLGTGLMLLPLHNPLILAKRLATLDQLSKGRVLAGFGIGWLAEEYEALAVPFNERGRRADEYLAIMRALWAPGATEYEGVYHHLTGVYSNPKPAVGGGVPFIIGGHSRAAMRRVARFGQGIFLLRQTPERAIELLAMLAEECTKLGRDVADIEITADAPRTAEEARVLADIGVDRLLLSARADDLDRFQSRIEKYNETIVATTL